MERSTSKKIASLLSLLFLLGTFIILPVVSHAATSFVSGNIVPQCTSPGDVNGECGWQDFLTLVNRFISFLLYLSATLAVLSFSYAGWLYLSSGGDTGKISQAHQIFWKVLVGFFFAFTAWLIVQLILNTVGLKGNYSLLH